MQAKLGKVLPDSERIIEQLNWRYATKKFDPAKKLSAEDWAVLEQALVLAPSSYGLQPYKFIVVTDDDLKRKLLPAAFGQTQIVDSSHLVVFAARKEPGNELVEEYIERLQEVRGTPREPLEEYIGQMKGKLKSLSDKGPAVTWSQRQAYIALGFLLETAALLGIDACPMEGFRPEGFDEILGLEDYTSSALCALGYRAEDGDWLAPLEKVRFPKEKLIEMR